jgi:hypothetical protein
MLCVLAEPSLTAKLDRETISLGESVTLSLVFEDVELQTAPSLPNIPNVRVGTEVSTSRNFSFVNGVSSRSITFNYPLFPTQPGEITIPRMEIKTGGRALASEPLKLKVLKSGVSSAQLGNATNLAFLRLMIPKTEVYVGESFPLEIQLYYQNQRVQDVRMPQLNGDGFSLSQPGQPTQTGARIGNAVFNVAVFKVFATAAKIGELSMGPAECGLSLRVPANSRRGDVFDLFFSNVQLVPTTLRSETQPIRVLPLPQENVPAQFNGTVGEYTLAVAAGPTDLAVGDPLTVKIRITGRGLLDALTLPAQPDWREFKSYPPSSKVEPTDGIGLSGVKTFEQVVVPQNSEIKSLPPFVFSFFDPGQKKYRTLSGDPIPLTIRPGGASPVVPTNFAQAGETPPPTPQDIVHIKPHLGEFAALGVPFAQQRWFLAIQAAPVLLCLSLLARRKHMEKFAANPRLRRQKEVARTVHSGLRELRQHAAASRAEEFFAVLFRLLQEQLGERLDLPASAITEAVIDERLREKELPTETLSALRELFQACNMARYARHTSQELASLVPTVERTLRDLQNLKP